LSAEELQHQLEPGDARGRKDLLNQPGEVFGGDAVLPSYAGAGEECPGESESLVGLTGGDETDYEITGLVGERPLDRRRGQPAFDRFEHLDGLGRPDPAGRLDQRLLSLGVVGLEPTSDRDDALRCLLGNPHQVGTRRPARKDEVALLVCLQWWRVLEVAVLAQRLEPIDAGEREEAVERDDRVQNPVAEAPEVWPGTGQLFGPRQVFGVARLDPPGDHREHRLCLLPELLEGAVERARRSEPGAVSAGVELGGEGAPRLPHPVLGRDPQRVANRIDLTALEVLRLRFGALGLGHHPPQGPA